MFGDRDDVIPLADLPAYLKAHPYRGPFQPVPHYSIEGDMLILYFEDADCFSERLGEYADVERAMGDRRVVGVKIFGVKGLIREAEARRG